VYALITLRQRSLTAYRGLVFFWSFILNTDGHDFIVSDI
jgi:hypothetical protein